MHTYESYKQKYGHLNADEKELRRKFYKYLDEQELVLSEAKQGLNAITAVSAVASAGGGERPSGRTAPPFGVNEFITTWKTDNAGVSASNQIQLPLASGFDYWFQVDWGDGSKDIIQSATDPARIHTYSTAGTYTVKISGTLEGWQFNNGGDRLKFLAITQWGFMRISVYAQFAGCANLQVTAMDLPTLGYMGGTFWNCTALTNVSRISEWDVSNVTDMFQCFRGCVNFNDDVTGWNVSNLTSAFRLFMSCSSFNRNLSSWNTGKIQFFSSMFNSATSFTNGGSSGINNWNTSSALSLEEMFRGASSFNQPIGNWDVSKVTNLRSMFRDCPFNQDVSGWNVSSVTNFSDVFITSGAVNDLSNWNVSNGTNFSRMFAVGGGGDFSLGSWDIRNATNMSDFVYNFATKFSTASYDAGLNYWATLPLKNNVTLSIGATKYSAAAQSARNYIVSTFGWTIIDGGLLP